jgi:hypothetical protein
MQMSFALTYEYEDVLAELVGGRVIAPPVPGSDLSRRAWRAVQAAGLLTRGWRRRPSDRADVVLAVGQNPQDLVPGFPVADVVESAPVSAAYMEELWVADLPLQPDVAAYVNRFDHVFLGVRDTCEPLAGTIRPSVSYLPPAVDVERFTASPWPQRDIAAYAMGRRNAAHHDVLLGRAERHGNLYLYDTFDGNPVIGDHVEHRRNLRGLIRRSHVFLVNAAKADDPGRTHQQQEVGFRYFEGSAGGAVLVGQRPDVPSFEEHFPWDGAVVEAAPDGSDLDDVLDALDSDPARVEAIRRDNITGSLRRHDIAHRLRTMLTELGLDEPEAVGARLARLQERATRLE